MYCLNNPLKFTDPTGNYIAGKNIRTSLFFQRNGSTYGITSGGGGGSSGGYAGHLPSSDPGVAMNDLLNSTSGGYWQRESGGYYYSCDMEAYISGCIYNEINQCWGYTEQTNLYTAATLGLLSREAYNASLTASLEGGPSGGGNKAHGLVYSFSFDFAFGGGTGFEIGLVTDQNGGKQWFVSGNANIGYGISAGLNIRYIESIPGSTFIVTDYKGYSNGFNIGIGPLGYSNSGDKISGQWSYDGLLNYGKSYIEEGWGYSIFSNTPTYGVIWSNTSTKFIHR